MDVILGYWQGMGVAGFRVDMAHMVPLEFWRWAVTRARARDPRVLFMAEAYDDDPAKLVEGNVLDALLAAGFDAVYDHPAYGVLKGLYDAGKWCNDLDPLTFTGARFDRSLRYGENHDEVRLANPQVWGGHGMRVGRPVCAVLFALGRGPVLVYHGQEVGEPALGAAGFGGDDARTTIFDYWSMPEFQRWVNGGRHDGALLTDEQRALRGWYRELLHLLREPAFTAGGFYGLNHANRDNPAFGRLDGEAVSGHWLYAFLRRDERSGQAFLVAANFHGTATLCGVRVRVPDAACAWLGRADVGTWSLRNRLGGAWERSVVRASLADSGLELPDLAPCSAVMVEIVAPSGAAVGPG
jgi:glycosidase